MADIKPIETEYNGYRFRSRLEARWAVFFDIARIKYVYEPEGFQLEDGTYYLPDFYLPEYDVYVEVKRNTPDGISEITNKCWKAVVWGGPIKAILVLSDIPEGRSVDGGIWHFPILYWNDGKRWGWWFFHDKHQDGGLVGQISGANYTPPLYGRTEEYGIQAVSDEKLRPWNPRRNEDYTDEQLIWLQEDFNPDTFKAFAKARQARFEHGETPTI